MSRARCRDVVGDVGTFRYKVTEVIKLSGIRLSEEHGVNPSVDHCFFCGEDYAVALFGKLKGDVAAPHSVCTGGICDRCEKVREQGGVFLIEINSEDGGKENPRRTGRMCALKEEAIHELFQPAELAETVVKKGMAYVEEGVLDKIGIPEAEEGEIEGDQKSP